MKKISILALLLISYSFGEVITIVDNGIERKIYINSKNDPRSVIREKGIIVSFKSNDIDISNFASKYKLKLKKRLSAGYYIFINNSKYTDIDLIKKISKESKDIVKTIRPNWGLGMIPR
jgi:hypothetical protein